MSLPKPWIEALPRPKPGGQGDTFRVTRPDLEGLYCLKRLRNINSDVRRLRFEREIITMRELRARGLDFIPEISEEGYDPAGRPYFVTVWMPVCLTHFVGGVERLGSSVALAYIRQLAVALGQLHEHGFAHRDVKPSNLLSDGQKLSLADFGLCLPVDEAEDRLTESAEAVGSRLYIPPELAAGRWDEPDQRPADFYSFGKTLWALLAGRPPMDREQHREAPWRLGRILDDDRYDLINPLLDELLQPDPTVRMKDWPAVIRELDWIEEQLRGTSTVDERRFPALTLEQADRIRRKPDSTARERSRERMERVRRWFAEVNHRVYVGAHSIDEELARLKERLGADFACRVVDGDTVPWLDALSSQLSKFISLPPLTPIVTDLRGAPTMQLGGPSSEPTMRLPFYQEIVGQEGVEELWLYPPVDRASATPYTVNFSDGYWPGSELAAVAGPLPLFLESSLDQASKFALTGAADWLGLCAAYVSLLDQGALIESADHWKFALQPGA